MCGITGIMAHESVNQLLFDSLTVLQHRGQDAAGIMTCEKRRFYLRKGNGLARDVLRTRHMKNLIGNMGIGHVRYPTAGSASEAESQPFYVNSPYGIALAHNGNLTNSQALSEEVFRADLRHINTNSDSEVLLNIFAHELSKQGMSLTPDDIFSAITRVYERCDGGYAAIAMISGYGLVGFRDPNAIRPIVIGKREGAQGTEYMIASESVALDVVGFDLIRDVQSGEVVYVDMQHQLHTRVCATKTQLSPCIFEHVYLARPDSIMDGINIYHARMQMGVKLAEKINRVMPNHDIDVVIPIPDTSRNSALELAQHLGLTYREGFIKNRYIGRTFIMPGQTLRKKSVRQKLNAIDMEFEGKNVLLVDDSIVRGTTCNEIIMMAREAGANKVYFASAAPPVRYPNVYGIDMPAAKELIAHDRTEDEICKLIGSDWLVYQDLNDLVDACKELNPEVKRFDCSVFNGEYITGGIDQVYLNNLEKLRNDAVNNANDSADSAIELHNDSSLTEMED